MHDLMVDNAISVSEGLFSLDGSLQGIRGPLHDLRGYSRFSSDELEAHFRGTLTSHNNAGFLRLHDSCLTRLEWRGSQKKRDILTVFFVFALYNPTTHTKD